MFVARADVLLAELAKHRPSPRGRAWRRSPPPGTPRAAPGARRRLADAGEGRDRLRGRRARGGRGRVAVVPAAFGWDDVGDFAALAACCRPTRACACWATPATCWRGTPRVSPSPGSGRLLAVLGLDDVVVVDTPDAVLVTTRARAQDVKAVVEALRASAAPTCSEAPPAPVAALQR